MRAHASRGWAIPAAVLLVCGVSGCGGPVAPASEAAVEPRARLGDTIPHSVSGWLAKSRAELAELTAEAVERVGNYQKVARLNPASVLLLPDLRPPVDPPVWQQAAFSGAVGFSLPPYLSPGTLDAEAALHLARHGDVEAALKLVDPADSATKSRIEALRGDKNYPVEWTRLVGLALIDAQFKLANGDEDAAGELIGLHRQLVAVLDKKAAAGPLGAALLPAGRRALAAVAPVWREKGKADLADDVEAALATWGDPPASALALRPGASCAEAARYFKSDAAGKAIATTSRQATARALDLLCLPAPKEGVQELVAFFDNADRLAELFVAYQDHVRPYFPAPANLAHYLLDRGLGGKDAANSSGLKRQAYASPGLSFDVLTLSRTTAAAGFFRVRSDQPAIDIASLPRSFGPLHLDGTYEASRSALFPKQHGVVVRTEQSRLIDQVKLPIAEPRPVAIELRREDKADLVAAVIARYPTDLNLHVLDKLAGPLWSRLGSPAIETSETSLGFVWEDGRTRLALRVPFNDSQSPEFVAADRVGADLDARGTAAQARDLALRKARFEARDPHVRLRRWVELEAVQLGQTKSELRNALPVGKDYKQVVLPDGWLVLFLRPAPKEVTYWPQQMLVRFGPNDRVAEIRVRYSEGPAAPSAKVRSLADESRKHNGAPAELPAPWAGLWTDLPAQRPSPTLWRWQDDTTLVTLQRDGSGAEVIARDCPLEHPDGFTLPPWQFLSRGPEGLVLGEKMDDVLKKWRRAQPDPTADGATVLVPNRPGPYTQALVWFETGKVARVVAQHTLARALGTADLPGKLSEVWAADLLKLGWPRRQERSGPDNTLQGYAWHDDLTRVRLVGQETERGVLLLTEWRAWPLEQKTAGR